MSCRGVNWIIRRMGHSAEKRRGKRRENGLVKFALGCKWDLGVVNDIRVEWAFGFVYGGVRRS